MADMNKDPEETPENGGATPDTEESTQTLCQKWFNDYVEHPLETDLEVAKGAATVGCIGYDEGKVGTQISVCRLEDARKVRGEYRGINTCISSTLAAHATGLKTNVTGYVGKHQTLEGKLTKALEAIKAARNGMAKVYSLACKLETARKDSCNSEQCKAIEKGLPKVDGVGGLERFNNEVTVFKDGIATLNTNADAVFEMGIKYAGIQASTNVVSLEAMANTLETDAKALATNVTDQSTVLDAKITEQSTALAKEITSLSAALYARHYTQLTHDWLTVLKTELQSIVKQDCGELDYAQAKDRLTEICETAVTTFNSTSGCGDADGGNKFHTQDAPSC